MSTAQWILFLHEHFYVPFWHNLSFMQKTTDVLSFKKKGCGNFEKFIDQEYFFYSKVDWHWVSNIYTVKCMYFGWIRILFLDFQSNHMEKHCNDIRSTLKYSFDKWNMLFEKMMLQKSDFTIELTLRYTLKACLLNVNTAVRHANMHDIDVDSLSDSWLWLEMMNCNYA